MDHDPVVEAATRGDYGLALRLARQRKGWSQHQLAARVGCDRSMISRLENRGTSPTVDLLRSLARALEMPPRSFGLLDTAGPSTVGGPSYEGDHAMRRRAFLLAAGAAALTAGQAGPVAAATSRPSPATLLHGRFEQVLLHHREATPVRAQAIPAVLQLARRDYRATRYFDLSHRLAVAMVSSENAVADADTAVNQAFLAQTYNAMTRALFKLPASGLEWITTDRALRAARRSDDPLLVAETRRILAVAYRRSGNYGRALQVFTSVADELTAGGHHLTGTTAIATYCAASYAAAKSGDRELARDLIGEASALSRHVTNDRQHWQAVDPATDVEVYRVSIGTALHDPGTSLRAISAVSLEALPTTERRARFLVDAAAARLAAGQLDVAARTLALAVRVAPQEVPSRATAHAVAGTLRHLRPDLAGALRGTGL